MKKIFIIAATSFILTACNNKQANQSDSNGSGQTTEATVSDEQVKNPATADNPTALPVEFPVMSFKNTEHNFGDILENQKVETTFEFTNTGKADLLIADCKAACGCTVPDWPKTPIKPGASGKIKVVFDSAGKAGLNNKTVTVIANTQTGSVELKFTANVRALKPQN